MEFRRIFPHIFNVAKVDEELILFCTIFVFTLFLHIQLRDSTQFYWCTEGNWKKCRVVGDIFRSFLDQVSSSRWLPWSLFFEHLHSANKLGNKDRIRFIQRFIPEISQIPIKIEKQAARAFNKKTKALSPKQKTRIFYSKNQEEKLKIHLKFYQDYLSLKSPNPKAPSMESFVEIKCTESRGRCLIVTKAVPLGSTLLIENPFVACLDVFNRDVVSKRCYHCFQKITGSKVTCLNCHFANFCSEDCLLAAFSSYHKYECPCFPLLSDIYRHNQIVSHILALVFRTVCSRGPQKLYKMYTESKNQEPSANTNAIYESSDYRNILELHQKIDQFSDWTAPLSCLILTQILRSQSSFFTELKLNEDFDLDEFQEFVATLMLHNFESFLLNAFALQQPEKYFRKKGSNYQNYGAAIYATTSLINHSCLPNAVVSFESRFGTAVVTSLRDLRQGEEIRISYGPIANSENSETADDRMRYLKRNYGFDCDCQGCCNGWPGLKFVMDFNFNYKDTETEVDVDLKIQGLENFTGLQDPLEKLGKYRQILSQMMQKRPENHFSPSFFQIQDDFIHLLRFCIARENSGFW